MASSKYMGGNGFRDWYGFGVLRHNVSEISVLLRGPHRREVVVARLMVWLPNIWVVVVPKLMVAPKKGQISGGKKLESASSMVWAPFTQRVCQTHAIHTTCVQYPAFSAVATVTKVLYQQVHRSHTKKASIRVLDPAPSASRTHIHPTVSPLNPA